MSDGQADWADSMDVVMLQEKIKTLRKRLAERDKEIERLLSAAEDEAVFGDHNLIPSYKAEIERLRGAGLDLIQKVNFMGLSVTLDDDVIDAIEDFEQALQGKSE